MASSLAHLKTAAVSPDTTTCWTHSLIPSIPNMRRCATGSATTSILRPSRLTQSTANSHPSAVAPAQPRINPFLLLRSPAEKTLSFQLHQFCARCVSSAESNHASPEGISDPDGKRTMRLSSVPIEDLGILVEIES